MYHSRKPFIQNFQDQLAFRSRGYLPHLETPGGIYFVTFRLEDALPAQVVEKLRLERKELISRIVRERLERDERAGRPRYGGRDGRATKDVGSDELSLLERLEVARLFALRVDRHLDAGMGSCVLRDDRTAGIVAGALRHFDQQRYWLDAWTVMPNHVHVILQLLGGWTLGQILHSWKSYTSKEINRVAGRSGQLWQEEYFDRLIRDAEEAREAMSYVLSNPTTAGLENWKWVWGRE